MSHANEIELLQNLKANITALIGNKLTYPSALLQLIGSPKLFKVRLSQLSPDAAQTALEQLNRIIPLTTALIDDAILVRRKENLS